MSILKFLSKNRIWAVLVVLLLLIVILVPILAFAKPANGLEFIDMSSSPDYCSDISAAYDRGVDITKYKNTVNVGTFSDNSAVSYQYVMHSTSRYGVGQNTYLPGGGSMDKDDYQLETTKHVRLIPDASIDGIVIDFYVASNLKSSKHAQELFDVDFVYQDWSFDIERPQDPDIVPPTESNNYAYPNSIRVNRKALLMGGSQIGKLWRSTKDYQLLGENAFLYSYVVVIRHNPNVTVIPVDRTYHPDMEKEQSPNN